MYTDVINRRIFRTNDHSSHLKPAQLSFVPSEITYKPDIPFVFVIHDKVSPTKQVCTIYIKYSVAYLLF